LFAVFWVVTPCALAGGYHCFRGICCLHFKAQVIRDEVNIKDTDSLFLLNIGNQTTWCHNSEDHEHWTGKILPQIHEPPIQIVLMIMLSQESMCKMTIFF
jgi:hypothetical protein